jgi:hypothetical protein
MDPLESSTRAHFRGTDSSNIVRMAGTGASCERGGSKGVR